MTKWETVKKKTAPIYNKKNNEKDKHKRQQTTTIGKPQIPDQTRLGAQNLSKTKVHSGTSNAKKL